MPRSSTGMWKINPLEACFSFQVLENVVGADSVPSGVPAEMPQSTEWELLWQGGTKKTNPLLPK